MIDIENLVYTNVRNAIKTYNSAVSVSGTYDPVPSHFPHVSIEETDSYIVASELSANDRERAVNVTYTATIYTNTATAKTDGKELAAVVNDAFTGMGFVRSMKQEMPNIDRTIYRLIMRFQALVWRAYDGVEGHYNITAR